MNDYVLFYRVPGAHPRWHAQEVIPARSRPDALRRAGYEPAPRQNGVITGFGYRMTWRADRIDFDHRAIAGHVVCAKRA